MAMKNYLCINGKKTELTEEQMKQLGLKPTPIATISKDGKIVKIGDYEFIVLNRNADKTELLLKDFLYTGKFGDSCDYRESEVRKKVENFGKEIEIIIGSENLIEHTVDLTADDGLDDFGSIKAKTSLLTCEQYRKYVKIIDNYKMKDWWWLATPYSTPTHGYDRTVRVVGGGGALYDSLSSGSSGVRPFCIVVSKILEPVE